MNAAPVIAQQTYDAPIDAVWKAITDKDQMRKWFFEPMTEFEPEVGFETEFNIHCEGEDFLHLWKVTDVVAQKQITYQWQYDGYSGDSSVTWELSEVPEGTQLTLTHHGIETFPQDNPSFSRASTQAGWDYFVHESLKAFLEDKTKPE